MPTASRASAFRMTPTERRASISLAGVFALRMLGLFVILPVFSVYARRLPGGESEFLAGAALGIYGLAQGILQIPYGIASDRIGRKPVIIAGLVIFALGSFIAAFSNTIWGVMLGRMIQGSGAVSAAVTALISDSVREQVLAKAMAMTGASIGFTFALSLVVSPPLARLVGVDGLFFLTGLLAAGAILVVKLLVPEAPPAAAARRKAERRPWTSILTDPQLLRLNIGIFALHASLTAVFVGVPTRLASLGLPSEHHWRIYLPAVLIGFAFMAPPLAWGSRKGRSAAVLRVANAVLSLLFIGLIHSVWGEGLPSCSRSSSYASTFSKRRFRDLFRGLRPRQTKALRPASTTRRRTWAFSSAALSADGSGSTAGPQACSSPRLLLCFSRSLHRLALRSRSGRRTSPAKPLKSDSPLVFSICLGFDYGFRQ